MPTLLDLYCGAGGAAKGYREAGFDYIIGVDIKPQPHYPFPFVQGDALEYVAKHGEWFDAIHASPPCQAYTHAGVQWRKEGREYPDLVAATREALKATRKPYVIENVLGAPLENPIMLNGAMFGLRVMRDRLFETSFEMPFTLLPCQAKPIKMGRPFDARREGTFWPVGHFSGVQAARETMEIDWMTGNELSQAIPPAYTRYIGQYLLAHVEQ